MTEERKYLEYAETLSEVVSMESEMYNRKRLLEELKKELMEDSDGGFGVEITSHAFKQISERLEEVARENKNAFVDVIKEGNPSKSLLIPSNLKSFIITTLANAREKGMYTKEDSRGGGVEFRYKINIKKWSGEKTLELVLIVENGKVKTGFFNWI